MARAPTDIRSLARAHTELALNTLAGIARMCHDYPSAQVAACVALLDRGWGKPQADGESREHINITIRKILEGSVTVTETTPPREIVTIEHEDRSDGNDQDTDA